MNLTHKELVYSRAFYFSQKGGVKVDEEARALRNEYMREWRRNNQERVKVIQARYWEKKFRERFKDKEVR